MGSKIITTLTSHMSGKNNARRKTIGNCIYVPLKNGINIKFYCMQKFVAAEVISKACGKIDYVELPFKEYFFARECSASQMPLYPFVDVDEDKWGFSGYEEMIPTKEECSWLALDMEKLIALYDVPEEDDA